MARLARSLGIYVATMLTSGCFTWLLPVKQPLLLHAPELCRAEHGLLRWRSAGPKKSHIIAALFGRSSLAPGAAPTLVAAGASLAAAFLDTGLAVGDALVLKRLMSLLGDPLSSWQTPEEVR